MIAYILRRVVNYVILTALATTGAYMLTSSFMDPAKRYRGKNPPLPESTITAKLDELGVNPDTRSSPEPGTGRPTSSSTQTSV